MNPLTHFREARDLGGAYLLAQQAQDGGFPATEPNLHDYYKVLRAFQVCGHTDAATRLCAWIRKNGMTPDGDFGPRRGMALGHNYAYLNAWVIIGAHRLGQFDLSHKGMDFLTRFRDPVSGGFYASPTGRDADTEQDLMVTCMCGLAALYTGRIEIARGVGEWLQTVMKAQPDFPERLYTVYTRENGLCTEPHPEDETRFVLHSNATRDENFFNPGIAGAFLARLFQATAEKAWLDLAMEYVRCAEVASDFLFRIVRAGKVGWAASVLYTLTGAQKYREMAVRIGHNLTALQAGEGYWRGGAGDGPSNDSTAERVAWMDEIHQAVSRA